MKFICINTVYLTDIQVITITINGNEILVSWSANNSFPIRSKSNNFLAFLTTTKRLLANPENPRQLTPKPASGHDLKSVSSNFQTLNFPFELSKSMSSKVPPSKTPNTLLSPILSSYSPQDNLLHFMTLIIPSTLCNSLSTPLPHHENLPLIPICNQIHRF